jgi:RNA processing factor Prp31
MSFEDLKAAIAALMDEIVRRPEDRHVLQERLREKISELETLGLPVPEDFRAFEKSLSDKDMDDPFENLPV